MLPVRQGDDIAEERTIMADCYHHGYSGGPGACKFCEEEDKQKLEPGTLSGHDMEVTTSNWKKGKLPPNKQP